MEVLEQQLTDFDASNLVLDHSEWLSGSTYVCEDTVREGAYYYLSVIDNNTGRLPSENDEVWLRMGTVNSHAMLDERSLNASICDDTTNTGSAPNNLSVAFASNIENTTLALGNVYASQVVVEIKDSGSQFVWTETVTISHDPEITTSGIVITLPPYDNTHDIEVVFYEKTGTSYTSCAFLLYGNSKYLGDTLYGYSSGLEDFSIKELDEDGILTMTKKNSRQTADIDFVYAATDIKPTQRVIRDIMGKVVLFIGDETTDSQYEHLLTLGVVESYTTILSNAQKIEGSLSVAETI